MKFLLPTIQQAFPSAISCEPLAHPIVQANAEGQLVSVSFEDVDTPTKICFVKTVDALQYNEKKEWPDLRRTLMYLRTEVRFYEEILPDLLSAMGGEGEGVSTPEIFAAGYDLDGLLTEEERATDDPTKGPLNVDWSASCRSDTSNDIQQKKGGYIVMEAISESEYMQDSPITIGQAKEALETIATFHASAWENKSLLGKAQDRLSKGSYHLKTRNPKEVAGLPDAWAQFSKAFGIEDDGEGNLGKRIQDLADYICEEVSPGPTEKYATLSHGDCKAMNCFLPIHKEGQTSDGSTSRGAILVDFASTGVGLGMSDVAMLINHAVRPENLENGGEAMLIDHYLDVLNKKLSVSKKAHLPLDAGQGKETEPVYSRETALWHYKLAVADYFRFFLGRFWKTATPETFEKKKHNKNTALINRDRDAAIRFLGRAKTFISEIETQRSKSD
mmetsp:Transcript_24121/g.56852  ORF Transcript_24121/g.56852 Transcript_24121/m.56852 type:complete len:445 (+) Transcript_24121:98-1432(+)